MRIGFIGAGQMARALACGFVARGGIAATEITAADCVPAALEAFERLVPGARVTGENLAAATCDVVVLALKPQHLVAVMDELSPVSNKALLLSIAAGVPLKKLCAGLGTERIVRVMPNTPALVGAGAAAYCRGNGVSDDDASVAQRLLESVGRCWELPESLLDAVTGLSGSGPAFVFQFIEALSDGGVNMGLPRAIALQLAAQTVFGAAQMVLETGEHPAVLKDRVTSPGGTTIAGLHALEQGALRSTVISAVQAATERSRELAE